MATATTTSSIDCYWIFSLDLAFVFLGILIGVQGVRGWLVGWLFCIWCVYCHCFLLLMHIGYNGVCVFAFFGVYLEQSVFVLLFCFVFVLICVYTIVIRCALPDVCCRLGYNTLQSHISGPHFVSLLTLLGLLAHAPIISISFVLSFVLFV